MKNTKTICVNDEVYQELAGHKERFEKRAGKPVSMEKTIHQIALEHQSLEYQLLSERLKIEEYLDFLLKDVRKKLQASR